MMVQLRASLEAVVMQAWRDRWTELEWSVNLKAALAEDTSEVNKLCGFLLKQATLSEVPNKLMFSYLSYTVAAQVVSHASLLEAVVSYKDFNRELCIESILDLLNFIRDRLKCDSSDNFQCEKLCNLLTRTMDWLLVAVEHMMTKQNASMLAELIGTLVAFMHNPFVTLCLYFDQLETPGDFQILIDRSTNVLEFMTQCDWVSEALKNDFRSFGHKFTNIPQLFFGPTRAIDPREINPAGAHPAVISVASVYGSVRVLECPEKIAHTLEALYQTFRLPWWLMLRDFMRGSLLLQLDPGPQFPESTVTAFVYLKVPRVLENLVQRNIVSSADVIRAVENVAGFHPLLNSLDMKTRSNCFNHFLEETRKLRLLNDHDVTVLSEIRDKEKISFSEPPPNNQAVMSLVLKAEPTFQTLIKSFSSEFASKQNKLVQMMCHMITGKSFEYICAAAAATDRLDIFSAKLAEFNRTAQSVSGGEDHDLRFKMFDLSFLLLSRISYLYSCNPIREICENSADLKCSFFNCWCTEFGNPNFYEAVKSTNLFNHKLPLNRSDANIILEKLVVGQPYWDKQSCDWGEMCYGIPFLGDALLEAIKQKNLNETQLKTIFETLQMDVCSLLLCLAQWLLTKDSCEERKFLASSLQSFFDLNSSGNEADKAHIDRRNFMAVIVRKLLNPLLAVSPVQCPPYPWLMHCGRHQLPQIGILDIPRADHLKQTFIYALRQGWACSGVLSLIDRCIKVGDQDKWTRAWVDEIVKLISVDEMSLSCEMCLGVAVLGPSVVLLSFVQLVADFVLATGHELYCVAPRGTVLAKFLVHALVLAFQLDEKNIIPTSSAEIRVQNAETDVDADLPLTCIKSEEPKAKIRRVDNNGMLESSSSRLDPETVLKSLYKRFGEFCEDGEVRPAIYFVASFLRNLSEHTSLPAKKMTNLLPLPLLNQVIRTDPKIISAPTVLALYNLEERPSRQRALQNLCLLRQLRAL